MPLQSKESFAKNKIQNHDGQIVNLIGALTASIYMLLIIAVFVSRIFGWLGIGYWIGISSSLVLIPLVYLFINGLK
jgi:hypothetical protein